jgi:hypothetical protein
MYTYKHNIDYFLKSPLPSFLVKALEAIIDIPVSIESFSKIIEIEYKLTKIFCNLLSCLNYDKALVIVKAGIIEKIF